MGKHFLWDPVEDNIVKEIVDSGTTIADYTTEPYLYGDLISQHRGGQSSFFHYDGQGSTTSLTNAAGNVTDTYAYSSFGEVTAETGSTVNPFHYIGQKGYYRDIETGEYEVRRRTLSLRARWSSSDPVLFAEGPNGYIYSRNCPNLLIDPGGTKCIVCKWRRRVDGDDVDASDVGLADPIHRIGIDMWSLQKTLHGNIDDWERTSPTHRKYTRPKVPKIDKYGPFAVVVDSLPPAVSYVITYAPYAVDAYVCGDDCLVTVIETGDEWMYDRARKHWKHTEVNNVTKPFDNYKPITVASGMGSNCMASLLDPAPKTGCNKMIALTDIPTSIHFVTGEEYIIRVVKQWIYISDGPFQDEAHST